ncbi:PH domain-containing protein [Lactococcus taiwanensis]|uniref:PH domain-containing protein n=1 Tax=Lactococcus taiwanensis TaxID=1151742 RepID=UPI00196531BC|nr:PH domain-containing protein [Lactococcus taiwanensis]QRZ11768.1 PH domain-containing protein [Lactococcus taiwanensis]
MIDFNNAAFVKLKPTGNDAFRDLISSILTDNESLISTFKGIRDGVVFTTHRIIAINVQGITGKKKDFTSLPYSKIQAFSIETAGTFDLDSELELWFSGLGKVKLEFISQANVSEIAKIISDKIL